LAAILSEISSWSDLPRPSSAPNYSFKADGFAAAQLQRQGAGLTNKLKESGMGRIVVMNHLTLDGVMQGPGRPDEDTRGGFTQGGWAQRSTAAGDAAGKAMGERMTAGGGFAGWLFGRRTYEDVMASWNSQGGPFKEALNNAPKYVASTTFKEPLSWPNSTLLRGDVPEAVCALKDQTSGVLAIMGSGELIASLMARDLIDEYLLMIHPLVLGTGRRLFPDDVGTRLRLTNCTTTPSGVVITTYEPVKAAPRPGQESI